MSGAHAAPRLALVALALLIAASTGCRSRRKAEPVDLEGFRAGLSCPDCSVLLVVIDTLRADTLPCLGYPEDTTPRMCAFGEKSVTFTNAYSAAPATMPALNSMMTGSIVANERMLDLVAHYQQQTFLAEELKRRGYATAAFTDHHGIGDAATPEIKTTGLVRGYDTFTNIGVNLEHLKGPELNRLVIDWLEKHRREKFFAWVHYFDPHLNYNPAPPDRDRFGYDPSRCGRVRPNMPVGAMAALDPKLTEAELGCVKALHLAEVHGTDRLVGKLLDKLDALGVGEKTLVIITADHGEEFLERGRIGHGFSVHDELVRVPLFVRHPTRPLAGRIGDEVSTARIRDWVLHAVAGAPMKAQRDVITRTHQYFFPRNSPRPMVKHPDEFALVEGRQKIIFEPTRGTWRLYDLAVDPGERRNLWNAARKPDTAARLERFMTTSLVSPGPPSTAEVERFEEILERLKKLGYMRP